MITIREARVEDAGALGRMHVDAWRAAYRGMMPDDFLASLDPEKRAARWRERLATRAEGCATFVVTGDLGEAYGFASVGPARDEPGSSGELYAINVAPRAWGTGAGRALLARATRALDDFGHREAILWVVRQNARARRFYESDGWRQTGDRVDTVAENGFSFEVDELRYARAIANLP